jgi:segregation and condensation protein A
MRAMAEVIALNTAQTNTQNILHFKLPVFEGPLDLLLHLIKENKVEIYDIPIVEITKQYVDYLELMKELNLEIAGEFLVMSATLIYIKSKMLLPPDEKQQDEPEEDPRTELVRRLLEYQAFKEASTELRERETIWKNIFWRTSQHTADIEDDSDVLPFETSVFDLISAFRGLLAKSPDQVIEISRETLTVSDRINYIMEKLEGKDSIKFKDLFEQTASKIHQIITFLALLEIMRLGLIKAYQEGTFGSIWVMNTQSLKREVPEVLWSGR